MRCAVCDWPDGQHTPTCPNNPDSLTGITKIAAYLPVSHELLSQVQAADANLWERARRRDTPNTDDDPDDQLRARIRAAIEEHLGTAAFEITMTTALDAIMTAITDEGWTPDD